MSLIDGKEIVMVDMHVQKAMELFGLKAEQITPSMRAAAKEFNHLQNYSERKHRSNEEIANAIEAAYELKLCSHEFESCPLELIMKKLGIE